MLHAPHHPGARLVRPLQRVRAMPEPATHEQPRVFASEGAGPLLQRDYWAVIEGARCGPKEIGALLRTRFADLAPDQWVRFRRRAGDGPLEVGDELDVWIRWAGTFGVRVIHRDDNSLTVATLEGHPEVGRITFGAYRHASGAVIFHIRSRARSANRLRHAAFRIVGRPMQTKAWTDFVARVAAEVGEGVEDFVYEETRPIDEACAGASDEPTFLARGG